MKRFFLPPAALAALCLSACGGGSGTSSPTAASGMPHMKLAVADAPVDGAQHVVVKFTGVQLLPDSGDPVQIDFAEPKSIDLLTQSGTASAVLFDEPVAPGSYGQIRLLVVADGDPSNSYMQTSDGALHGLNIPSGDQTGLKLVSGFDVPASGIADYTVDFDLRKAITCPPGHAPACTLRPALRLVANDQVGNIAGIVDPGLLATGCTPGVYLYSGSVSAPEDVDSTATSDPSQPLSSKVPVQTANGLYYQFTFLEPGNYTVAFTCGAAQDNPDQNDHLVFTSINPDTSVTAGQTTSVDLVNNTQGSIAGTIDASLAPQGCSPGVYLYSGTVTTPEDKNTAAPSGDTNQPAASQVPTQSANGLQYEFDGLTPGSYTVAYTCQAADDNAAQNDNLTFDPVKSGVSVVAGATTTSNLP